MAGFVLIHGSWHGGWCFDTVAAILAARGHTVVAPTLPGMGGTAEEMAAVTLEDWGDFAAQHCADLKARLGGAPVVLGGHSRGGLVVSTAAERHPEAMDSLAYICAMMLPAGLSRAEFKEIVGPNAPFEAIIKPLHGSIATVIDPLDGAGDVFAQLSPPDAVAAVLPRLMAEPSEPRRQKIVVTPERWGSKPRTYVECTQDRTIPIDSQRRMIAMSPGAQVITLEADHSPYLSMPEALADALEAGI
ncbi:MULTISPECIES: alpha/beta fold hydrolase [unclassified Novosphingobium]|uniref:alpha/beta fold hydrolase n=1 Tax=unclassified Novosphingobium TaxID=2644732 RepID=UPI000D310A73|nr:MULTISPECIES: alpha/beta fold hydrolase [unclassified Novosphingobium]PTR09274.1 pimeloyl-ACP methyl ester carboxylesterase [Novosphingobium sp. GV055]PUB02125.1 pimeloyl-ACP methyl ester carboxylesterase [Novosphingobium sp. GV061]PUB18306.1 pimeloyl-ACP methyl ester carboxylesterase [Novosphingobium sp. GV079]PUB40558.1 pimeloyl-ACP methyl ester carboxylesterase [Novosphingobium sp. GV027]